MQLSFKKYQLDPIRTINTAQVTLRSRHGWRVLLHDQETVFGVGEIAPWSGFGAGEEKVKEEISRLESHTQWCSTFEQKAHILITEKSMIKQLSQTHLFTDRLDTLEAIISPFLSEVGTPEVRFGLELTLLDAMSRALSCPLSALLEPKTTLSTATHRLVCNYAEAIEAAQRGYRAIKIKVGINDHWVEELMEIARIRATLPHIEIRVDANQAWDAELAFGFCIAAQAFEIAWLEEPCRSYAERRRLLSKLEGLSSVPLGIDETIAQEPDHLDRYLHDPHIAVITLKPMFVGGLIRCAQLGLQAQKAGKRVCVTHALGSWIERTASAHLVAAMRPNIDDLAAGLGGGLSNDIHVDLPMYGGELRLSTSSGIGRVEVAEVLVDDKAARLSMKGANLDQSFHRQQSKRSSVLSVPHPLKMAALARPNHCAVISDQGSVTYAELASLAVTLIHRIQSEQTTDFFPGVSVTLSGEFTTAWLVTWHALTSMGVELISIHPKLSENEQKSVFRYGKVKYHLELKDDTLTSFIVLTDGSLAEPIHYPLDDQKVDQLSLSDTLACLQDWSWNAPLSSILTSGTTGQPQLISLATSQAYFSAFGSAIRLGHHNNDIWLACLPPYHIGGLSTIIRCTLNQITLQITAPKVGAIVKALKSATLGSLTPTLLSEVVQKMNSEVTATDDIEALNDYALKAQVAPHLRKLLIGGAATSRDLWDKATSLGLPLRLTWGMSEAASQVCTQVTLAPPEVPIPPLPFVTVESDQDHHLWIRGPITQNGVLKSNDLGQVSELGVLVSGRADDVIISGGVNLNPTEIEQILLQHSQISEAAVIGVKSQQYGMRPIAYLVASNRDSLPTSEELKSWCKQRLSTYKVPDEFRWIEQMPRNSMGKRLLRELKKLASQSTHTNIAMVNIKPQEVKSFSESGHLRPLLNSNTTEDSSPVYSRDRIDKKVVKHE